MASRPFNFGLLALLVFTVVTSAVIGMAGRWRRHQLLPKVSIKEAFAAEGDPMSFTIQLSKAPSSRVEVRVATRNGTARAGLDYAALAPTTLIFEPDETWKIVEIETIADDEEDEDDETVFLELVGAAGAAIEQPHGVGRVANGLAPADVAITRFYGDGKVLWIDYAVKPELDAPIQFIVMQSDDGRSGGPVIATGTGEGKRGSHTLVLTPEFEDSQYDYTLLAMADSEYAVDEKDEDNNFVFLESGSFVVREPASGKTVLHIQGSDRADTEFPLVPQLVDEVHFRGRGGDDVFDLNRLYPGVVGWLFGGGGNDTLSGSSAADVVFGGPGMDTLRGHEGRDLLVGGGDRDKLDGGTGQDELFGSEGDDILFAAEEGTRFAGGPGRDTFNGSSVNPSLTAERVRTGDYYRDVEDERGLRIDLASGFGVFVKTNPERRWQVKGQSPGIATWSVQGDAMHVEFTTGVPDVAEVTVRAVPGSAGRSSDGVSSPLVFRIYSIAVTGFKVERCTDKDKNLWVEEKGPLWTSDTLRWTPLYEPPQVPLTWNVKWLSKLTKDIDHPHVDWQVFATGTQPIANPQTGVPAITPQFEFNQNLVEADEGG